MTRTYADGLRAALEKVQMLHDKYFDTYYGDHYDPAVALRSAIDRIECLLDAESEPEEWPGLERVDHWEHPEHHERFDNPTDAYESWAAMIVYHRSQQGRRLARYWNMARGGREEARLMTRLAERLARLLAAGTFHGGKKV